MAFNALCQELSQMQLQLLRRERDPVAVLQEALDVIHSSREDISPLAENVPHIPLFLRCCATIFRQPTEEARLKLQQPVVRMATEFVLGNHGDVNDNGSVLQSLLALSKALDESNKKVVAFPRPSHSNKSASSSVLLGDLMEDTINVHEKYTEGGNKQVPRISSLVEPSYKHTMSKWRMQRVHPFTSTVITMLRGCEATQGSHFWFSPSTSEMAGLLPLHSKLQMERKMQKCNGCREILGALREMKMSKLDAGICLDAMAKTGLYDSEVSNACCEVLYSSHAVVTSQQFTGVLYNLGVLQHRHIHQKFFSSLVNFKKINAEAMRQHVLGLAMLHQPPHSEKVLMDGVFLHALRHKGPVMDEDALDTLSYNLPVSWYLDVGLSLECLGIVHHKFRLMLARQLRRNIRSMSTTQRVKMLYGLGKVDLSTVPDNLKESWETKVDRVVDILIERLQYDVQLDEGPMVMSCLVHCGVREHPMIPKPPDLVSGENPVELLLKTWSSSPKERILHLTEQIRPSHLGRRPAQRIPQVFTAIAANCENSSWGDAYHFGPLCEATHSHVGSMTVDEALRTLTAIDRIGIGSSYKNTLNLLLERLWVMRDGMTDEEQMRCSKALENFGNVDVAMDLLEYFATSA